MAERKKQAKKAPAKQAKVRPAAKTTASPAKKKAAARKKSPAQKTASAAKRPGPVTAAKPAAQPAPSPAPRTTPVPSAVPPGPAGTVTAEEVMLSHVMGLRPRIHVGFKPSAFSDAKRALSDSRYATVAEAARAVAEKAIEISNDSSLRAPFSRR